MGAPAQVGSLGGGPGGSTGGSIAGGGSFVGAAGVGAAAWWEELGGRSLVGELVEALVGPWWGLGSWLGALVGPWWEQISGSPGGSTGGGIDLLGELVEALVGALVGGAPSARAPVGRGRWRWGGAWRGRSVGHLVGPWWGLGWWLVLWRGLGWLNHWWGPCMSDWSALSTRAATQQVPTGTCLLRRATLDFGPLRAERAPCFGRIFTAALAPPLSRPAYT
jgi:hypothetical protein